MPGRPEMHAARRRLASEIRLAATYGVIPDPQAVVATVVVGAAADGNAAVTVTWMGTAYDAAYLASYSPVVGHVVRVEFAAGQLLILGRIIGTPA